MILTVWYQLTDKEDTVCTTEIQEVVNLGKYQLRYKSSDNILQLIDEEVCIEGKYLII